MSVVLSLTDIILWPLLKLLPCAFLVAQYWFKSQFFIYFVVCGFGYRNQMLFSFAKFTFIGLHVVLLVCTFSGVERSRYRRCRKKAQLSTSLRVENVASY